MKIKSLMSKTLITISEEATISEAIELMKINSIRHLPVIQPDMMLKGFVTMADLKQGLIPSMLGDLTLDDLMIKDPITVGPDDDIEMAAQYIYKNKIGGMQVVSDYRLVGVITGTDILRAFIEMMGILTASSRIDVVLGDEPGSFNRAFKVISDYGGDIISVGMTGQQTSRRISYFRLTSCKTNGITAALEKNGFEVLEAMD
jgi:acetoin utilization protein AcuB